MALSLREIQEFYAVHLENRIFQYTLRGGQVIELVFHPENLCHLLGIQHIIPRNKEDIGLRGYRKIQSGVLNLALLKKHDAVQYKRMRKRIVQFMRVADLLLNGSIYKFYFMRQKESQIRADYIVYWHDEEQKNYKNLFLAQERVSIKHSNHTYTAISYTVLHEKEDYDRYIRSQEYKEVDSFQIIAHR